MSRVKTGGFIAALLVTISVLLGASAAFADAPAPVFDHQVKIADGFYLVSVRDNPSSQSGDIGNLTGGQEYPAGAAVQGPASIFGGSWLPIKFEGHTGWVNSGMVTVSDLVAKPTHTKAAAVTPAKAPADATSATAPPATPQITWLVLVGALSLATGVFSYLSRRRPLQLVAAGAALATSIAAAILRPAGGGPLTAVPALVVALVAAAALFIAVLRAFGGERPSMQMLRPALKDWKVAVPLAAAVLIPVILLASLSQSQLVSYVAILTTTAAVFSWRFAIFSTTDRPQVPQVEPDEYRPRGFDPNEGAHHGR